MDPGKTCLSAVVASLLVSATSLRATEPIAEVSQAPSTHQMLPLSSSQALLATDASAFVRFLKAARPVPVSSEDKARVLSSLPEEGEVTNLNASARQKLAALIEVLRATERNSVYEIKVIALPQAAIGLHARSVVLISEVALALVDADELQALLAHEIGHEYVWTDYERSSRLADHDRLKDLELVCDGIAIVTLHGLGLDVSPIDDRCPENQPFQPGAVRDGNKREELPNARPASRLCPGDRGVDSRANRRTFCRRAPITRHGRYAVTVMARVRARLWDAAPVRRALRAQ